MKTLPEPQIAKVLPLIQERWQEASFEFCRDGSGSWRESFGTSFQRIFDATMRSIGANEGTVWLLNDEGRALMPAYNNGPKAVEWVGRHVQPLDRGIVSTVFITQQGICENYVYQSVAHDPTVMNKLRVVTSHMVAVPLYFGAETRGVVSAVKLRPDGATGAGDPPPFDTEAVQGLNALASIIGDVIDGQLLRQAISL